MRTKIRTRAMVLLLAMIAVIAASTRPQADTGTCGTNQVTLPFTDVPASNAFFCDIAEAYFSGLTNGTTATTYSPSANVPREQMAAFAGRTMDESVKRSSRRAALDQFWTPRAPTSLALTSVGSTPALVKSDGADLWVANPGSASVSRVRASDGVKVGDWTGATSALGVLIAVGKVYVTGETNPGTLYEIDPTQPPGLVTTLASNLGGSPDGIAFDGIRIWTANNSGSVSIITPTPLSVATVTLGFVHPVGIVFDGQFMWVTDAGDNTLKQVDGGGNVISAIPVGVSPYFPVFDGTNIWVPNLGSNTVSVVRATGAHSGSRLATLDAGAGPNQLAFDGERIMATHYNGDSVAIWKASDLSSMGTCFTGAGTSPFGVCSDGVNFWITLFGANKLARF